MEERFRKNAKVEAYRTKQYMDYLVCTNLSLFGGNALPLEYTLRYFLENSADHLSLTTTLVSKDFSVNKVLSNDLSRFLEKIQVPEISQKLSQYKELFAQTFLSQNRKINGGRLLAFSVNPEVADEISYVGNHIPVEFKSSQDGEATGKPSIIITELRKNPQAFEEKCAAGLTTSSSSSVRLGNTKDRPKSIWTSARVFPRQDLAIDPDNFRVRTYDLFWENAQQQEDYKKTLSALVKQHLKR